MENNYSNWKFDSGIEVTEPDYKALTEWIKETGNSAVCLDFWSRGNFIRRALWQKRSEIRPITIAANKLENLKWAYQRLALLGLPIDLIFTGELQEKKQVAHLHNTKHKVDAGWGYLAATESVKINGEEYFTIVGWAELLPPEISNWITVDNQIAFERGSIMVAPAKHIGFDPQVSNIGESLVNSFICGFPVEQTKNATTIMNLNIPFIEGLSDSDFDMMLAEHWESLADLRNAISALLREADILESARILSCHVNEIIKSSKFENLRTAIKKLGGKLKSFEGGLGLLTSASAIYGMDPFAGAAALGIVGKSLVQIWKETKDTEILRSSPFSLLIELGVAKTVPALNTIKAFPVAPKFIPPDSVTHWITPPNCGMYWVFKK
jgi:hypothetical protein